jgi:hypothetical protein
VRAIGRDRHHHRHGCGHGQLNIMRKKGEKANAQCNVCLREAILTFRGCVARGREYGAWRVIQNVQIFGNVTIARKR